MSRFAHTLLRRRWRSGGRVAVRLSCWAGHCCCAGQERTERRRRRRVWTSQGGHGYGRTTYVPCSLHVCGKGRRERDFVIEPGSALECKPLAFDMHLQRLYDGKLPSPQPLGSRSPALASRLMYTTTIKHEPSKPRPQTQTHPKNVNANERRRTPFPRVVTCPISCALLMFMFMNTLLDSRLENL